jgi:biotin transport system substrate-specific component
MTDAPEKHLATDSAAAAAVHPAPVVRSSVATDVALVSTFAAFIAVCAILPGIPTPSGVPITLQTFGVVLAGLVLGWRRGALAVLLYLAVGLAGVPVFADGTGGLVVLTKPSVGYLLAFPFAAAVAGLLAGRALRLTGALRYLALVGAGLGASFLTVHPAGIVGLMARLGVSFGEAFAIDVVYWPGDVVKNLLAAAVALAVFRAFPDLLRSRR